MKRRILKYSAWSIGIFFLFLCAVMILLQTTWFKTALVGFILDRYNENFRGTVMVGRVEGDLLHAVEFADIVVEMEHDTVVTVPRIRVEYQLAPLLSRRITVTSLAVDSPRVSMARTPDGVLRISQAVEPANGEESQNKQSQPFAWILRIDSLNVSGGMLLGFEPGDSSLLPAVIRDINLNAEVTFDSSGLIAHVLHSSLATLNPELTIEECRFDATADSSSLSFSGLVLRTRRNGLRANGRYSVRDRTASLELLTDPVRFEEFQTVTGDLSFAGSPTVRFKGEYRPDAVTGELTIEEAAGLVRIDGRVDSLEETPSFAVRGIMREIDIGRWVHSSLTMSPLSGTFNLKGRGISPDLMTARGGLELKRMQVREMTVDSVRAELELIRGSLAVSLSASAGQGSLLVHASGDDILKTRTFSIEGMSRHLNLLSLTQVPTDLSGEFSVRGAFPVSGEPDARAQVSLVSSRVGEVDVDEFSSALRWTGGAVKVDSARMLGLGVMAVVSGSVETKERRLSLVLSASTDDASRVGKFLGLDTLAGQGHISCTAAGSADSIQLQGFMQTANLVVNGTRIAETGASFEGTFRGDTTGSLDIPFMRLVWNGNEWVNSDPITIRFGPNQLEGQARLTSGDALVAIAGRRMGESELNISAEIRRLNIVSLSELFPDVPLRGILDLDLAVEGSPSNPGVRSSVRVTDAGYAESPPVTIDAGFTVADSVVTWSFDVERLSGGTFAGEGSFTLNTEGSDSVGWIRRDRPFHLSVKARDFDLGTIAILSGRNITVGGLFNGDLQVVGTADSVVTTGSLKIDNGTVAIATPGIAVEDIRIRCTGRNNVVSIDTLVMKGGDGSVSGSGTVYIVRDPVWKIRPDVRFVAHQFELLSGNVHSLILSGDVGFSAGEDDEIDLNGNINVDRSRFSVPDLPGMKGKRADENPPMLVAAARGIDTLQITPPDSAEQPGVKLPGVTGSVTVTIPRGTWLRGPRINVELRGELKIVMEHGTVHPLGYLTVEQGTYEFYGRKFVFTRGRADFEKQDKIDPVLYVEIEYTFRTEDLENLLLMVIRGPSSSPEITFFINKDPISEADAISYILFGRKVDDLNYGQKSAVTGAGDVLAKDLAANMINSRLSGVVGSALGLDVVRISGEDNWSKATLTAGKYVTDDVYVAYERGIAQSGSSNVAYEATTLEYYIWKFLYLRFIEATDQTSGVDLLLKFE